MAVTAVAANRLASDLDRVLTQIGDLWNDLRGARLFVTGGTGFFGCWMLETLLWASARLDLGAAAVVLTRDPAAFGHRAPHLAGHPSIELLRGDARSFDPPDGGFSHIIHAAADTAVPTTGADRLRVFDSIVNGTRSVLDLARTSRARRFLLTSTGAVYGPQPPDVEHLTEDYHGAPDALAIAASGAEAKRCAEAQCALYADERLQPVIARCFAFVGPYMPTTAHLAAGNFIRDAASGAPIRVRGDGTPVRSYMYASDLAAWLWTILLRGAPLRPYNVGSETPIAIGELAHAVARRCSPPRQVEIMDDASPSRARSRYVPGTARARHELGLAMTVDLDDALDRTLEWYGGN
jgi:nucleoside-diphosphate-sugar epimerase